MSSSCTHSTDIWDNGSEDQGELFAGQMGFTISFSDKNIIYVENPLTIMYNDKVNQVSMTPLKVVTYVIHIIYVNVYLIQYGVQSLIDLNSLFKVNH